MLKSIVVLYYDEDIATGGFYDCFEYYYILRKHFGPSVIFKCATNHSKQNCISQIKDKYEDFDNDIWDGIEFLPHYRGKLYEFEKFDLVFSAISASLTWFIRHKNILVADFYMGICDIHDLIPPSTYYKESKLLYDERIFHSEGRYKQYRKKILFDKYRKNQFDCKYDYMINLSLVERRYSKDFMINLIKGLPPDSKIAAYTDNKNKHYYSWLRAFKSQITFYEPPIRNFMSLFKTFVYIPYVDGHDSTPRLIPECKFYGKDILMYTDGFHKSGGHYRYNDTINDFDSLWLKEDDEIISIIEEVLNVNES
jgi:hypothetical protein